MIRIGRHHMGTLALFSAMAAMTLQTPAVRGQEKKPVPKVIQAKPKPKDLLPEGVKRSKPAPGVPEPTVVLKPGEVPQIKFDTPDYDFGRRKAGGDIRYDYVFTNTGTGPLELLKVKPSCGCTTAGSHDRIVQPGEKGKIPIKLGTDKFNGPVSKAITVYTNVAGDDSRITLHIKGEVWQVFTVTPNRAFFGRLTEDALDQTHESRVTIMNNTDSPANLTNIRSTNPLFNATVNTIQPGKQFELVITAGKSASPGPNSGDIELDTGLAENPSLKVSAQLYVAAAVDVTPPKLTLVPHRDNQRKRNLYVRNNANEPLTLSDFQATNPDIKGTIEETRPGGKSFRVIVDIPEGYTPAEGDQITLKTSNPKVPMLTIPIEKQGGSRVTRKPSSRMKLPSPLKQAPVGNDPNSKLAVVKKVKPATTDSNDDVEKNEQPAKTEDGPTN